ncbi:Rieske (2Fe-2S) protein [Caulobacter mirabilis]|uniref:2Fe-2S ferredoxin n=1 Tax=Caulobacter mirabilis TaxID=69666 RepID=A0A2D2ASQ6_9CAUL|nr:Rieske (2Fe-2S) protein [Caulobacter mirabilis]ATQ41007.1 2Fe-2S ferredoxin [Caulobacter mirabilis]
MPAAGTILCRLEEISDPGSKDFRFRAEDRLFAGFVVRQAGEVRGYVDSCPHAGWPLAGPSGRHLTREGDLILCAGHGALFRIEDGVCLSGPCAGRRLTPWPVAVRAGQVVAA